MVGGCGKRLGKFSIYKYADLVKINKKFVAIRIDKRGKMDYIYTVRVYTDLDLVIYRNGGG